MTIAHYAARVCNLQLATACNEVFSLLLLLSLKQHTEAWFKQAHLCHRCQHLVGGLQGTWREKRPEVESCDSFCCQSIIDMMRAAAL